MNYIISHNNFLTIYINQDNKIILDHDPAFELILSINMFVEDASLGQLPDIFGVFPLTPKFNYQYFINIIKLNKFISEDIKEKFISEVDRVIKYARECAIIQ